MGKITKRNKTTKVTRKIRVKDKVRTAAVQDPQLREKWDDSMNVAQNYKRLGLTSNLKSDREILGRDDFLERRKVGADPIEFNVPEAEKQKDRKFTPDGEKKMLMEMVKKFGDDVKGMARSKLNIMQHTVKQLQKKLDKMNHTGNGKFSGYMKNPTRKHLEP